MSRSIGQRQGNVLLRCSIGSICIKTVFLFNNSLSISCGNGMAFEKEYLKEKLFMKKTFTLLTTMILSVSLYAYYGQSRLSVSTTGNTKIRVMIDGNKYRADNNLVMIDNLNEGYHSVKIFQLKNSRNNNWGNGMSSYQMVYSGNVYLKPQYHVDIVVNRFGKAFTDEQPISAGYYEEEDDWGNDDRNNNKNEGGGYIDQTMIASAFEQFKQNLKNESFDDTKQNIAQQVISTNYFTSSQVREIMQQFSFESSKLEIAKYAYKYTVDKGSYFLVNDVFVFSTSKDELMRYIQAYK